MDGACVQALLCITCGGRVWVQPSTRSGNEGRATDLPALKDDVPRSSVPPLHVRRHRTEHFVRTRETHFRFGASATVQHGPCTTHELPKTWGGAKRKSRGVLLGCAALRRRASVVDGAWRCFGSLCALAKPRGRRKLEFRSSARRTGCPGCFRREVNRPRRPLLRVCSEFSLCGSKANNRHGAMVAEQLRLHADASVVARVGTRPRGRTCAFPAASAASRVTAR